MPLVAELGQNTKDKIANSGKHYRDFKATIVLYFPKPGALMKIVYCLAKFLSGRHPLGFEDFVIVLEIKN